MTNAPRDVVIDVNGKAYTLRLDLNAICTLEDVLSTPEHPVTFREALDLIEQKSLRATRALVWAGLRQHHPTMSIEDAGDLLLEMGGVDGIDRKIGDAVAAAMGQPPTAAKRVRARRI